MKSGLEGRNNLAAAAVYRYMLARVSMKSGLEGRNNVWAAPDDADIYDVSMKSGLEGRNNGSVSPTTVTANSATSQ